jgi:hypothetical protein
MTTVTLRLPDGAVYITTEQDKEQPVSKSAVTPAQRGGLAAVGATVVKEAAVKAPLIDALSAEAGRLEKAAIDLGPGHQDMKEIYKAKAAAHRARLAELTTGAQPVVKSQAITIDRKAVR